MVNLGICRTMQDYTVRHNGMTTVLSANSSEALYLLMCTPVEPGGFNMNLITENAKLKVQMGNK